MAAVVKPGLLLQQVLHDGQVTLLRGLDQRVAAVVVHFVYLGALFDQQLTDLQHTEGTRFLDRLFLLSADDGSAIHRDLGCEGLRTFGQQMTDEQYTERPEL